MEEKLFTWINETLKPFTPGMRVIGKIIGINQNLYHIEALNGGFFTFGKNYTPIPLSFSEYSSQIDYVSSQLKLGALVEVEICAEGYTGFLGFYQTGTVVLFNDKYIIVKYDNLYYAKISRSEEDQIHKLKVGDNISFYLNADNLEKAYYPSSELSIPKQEEGIYLCQPYQGLEGWCLDNSYFNQVFPYKKETFQENGLVIDTSKGLLKVDRRETLVVVHGTCPAYQRGTFSKRIDVQTLQEFPKNAATIIGYPEKFVTDNKKDTITIIFNVVGYTL